MSRECYDYYLRTYRGGHVSISWFTFSYFKIKDGRLDILSATRASVGVAAC